MRPLRRTLTWLALAVGLLPAYVLQCDKAALNFQRGFWYGLGLNASDSVADTFRHIRIAGN
jgi:hypothetical protein